MVESFFWIQSLF